MKWPKLQEIFDALGDKLDEYDAVWLPDDDISTNAENINYMFTIFNQQGFELAQPALTKHSYYAHKVTLENENYKWRYTNFVEVMVPLFSKEALKKCAWTFPLCQTAWGLDILWPKVLGYPHKKIAVIDVTPVTHTRPLGKGTLYKNATVSKWEELRKIEKKFNVSRSLYREMQYDGVLRDKKIIIALLAHKNEHVLKQQIKNIRYFVPEATVVLYNGGTNNNFARNLNVPVCPYRRQLKWGKLTPFLWDVMKWLNEIGVNYHYLMSLDDDILFIKKGFINYVDRKMRNAEAMGWDMKVSFDYGDYSNIKSIRSTWEEWYLWRTVFKTDYLVRFFNPGQIYRKQVVDQMLSNVDHLAVEQLLANTGTFAFEEIFFPTLASAVGGRCRSYPKRKTTTGVRFRKLIGRKELWKCKIDSSIYWIHPVKGQSLISMNNLLLPKRKRRIKRRIKSNSKRVRTRKFSMRNRVKKPMIKRRLKISIRRNNRKKKK